MGHAGECTPWLLWAWGHTCAGERGDEAEGAGPVTSECGDMKRTANLG